MFADYSPVYDKSKQDFDTKISFLFGMKLRAS